MSKYALAAVGTVGLASASVGGYYLLGGSQGGGIEALPIEKGIPKIQERTFLFGDVTEFKAKAQGSTECIKDYVDGFNPSEAGANGTVTSETWRQFFEHTAHTPPTPQPTTKSCVRLEYHRRLSEANNNSSWYGKFTWLWTVVSGDKAFVSFNVLETNTSGAPKQLPLSGTLYLLAKESGTWKVKHKKEGSTSVSITTSKTMGGKFPEAPNHLTTPTHMGKYWGWISEGLQDFDKMCSGDSCKSMPLNHAQVIVLTWNSGRGTSTVSGWASYTSWWDDLYNKDLVLATIKPMGTWTMKTEHPSTTNPS